MNLGSIIKNLVEHNTGLKLDYEDITTSVTYHGAHPYDSGIFSIEYKPTNWKLSTPISCGMKEGIALQAASDLLIDHLRENRL